MGCNCGNKPKPKPCPHHEDRDWRDVRYDSWDKQFDCNIPSRPAPVKEHNYFGDYTDIEKKLIAEQLGFSAGNVTVVNNADGEDLTSEVKYTQKVLKFKDKDYDPENFSGYGKVYLRKNIVSKNVDGKQVSVNILTQAMFQDKEGSLKDHTIFIIQYDYDLDGSYIDLPEDSILKFEGGSLSNGTLLLHNNMLYPNPIDLSKVTCNVTFRNNFADGQLVYADKSLKLYFGDGNSATLATAAKDPSSMAGDPGTSVDPSKSIDDSQSSQQGSGDAYQGDPGEMTEGGSSTTIIP